MQQVLEGGSCHHARVERGYATLGLQGEEGLGGSGRLDNSRGLAKSASAGKSRKAKRAEAEAEPTVEEMSDEPEDAGDSEAEGEEEQDAESSAKTSGSKEGSPNPQRKKARGGGKTAPAKGKRSKNFQRQ